MKRMVDVADYLQRLFTAAFFYPAVVAFWVLFGMAGFQPAEFFALCGNIGDGFAGASQAGQVAPGLQFIAGWALLAFLFLLMTFTFEPPKFHYQLKRKGHGYEVGILP